MIELTRSNSVLESRAVSAEARADGLVLSLDAKEQEVRESERRAEVEKRVLLEKIRALEGRDTASAARLSEVAGELGTLRGQVSALSEERVTLAATLDTVRAHEATLTEQVPRCACHLCAA